MTMAKINLADTKALLNHFRRSPKEKPELGTVMTHLNNLSDSLTRLRGNAPDLEAAHSHLNGAFDALGASIDRQQKDTRRAKKVAAGLVGLKVVEVGGGLALAKHMGSKHQDPSPDVTASTPPFPRL